MSGKHKREAYKDLFVRYGKAFSYYWQHRHDLRSGMFNEEEAQFLPAALAVQEQPPSKTARIISWLIIAIILVTLTWAIFGRMDIVVNATGKIIPSEYTKTIASVDTASVVALHVKEGQTVKAGDSLIELDDDVNEAERDKAKEELAESALQLERNEALILALETNQQPELPEIGTLNEKYGVTILPEKWQAAQRHIKGQYQDVQAKLAQLNEEIKSYEKALPLIAQQAANYRALAATNDVPRNAYLEKEQARTQLNGQLQIARSQRQSLLAETRKNAFDEIAQSRRAVAISRQDVERYTSLMRLYLLRSPIDGTVQQLTIHTIGGVVPAAQPLMQIVPTNGPVEVEAFIENKDKGFIHVGQTAAVKVDTFQYTKYGTLPGIVVNVSDDAIEDEKLGLIYAVKVRLEKAELNIEGKNTKITPGMSVSVEIKTGDRRIIEYVLSPLVKHVKESLNER